MSVIRSGFTLPVFACAAAIAALRHLHHDFLDDFVETGVDIDLIEPAQCVQIPIEQVARLGEQQALAIARSDPGDHLDLTRHTPIWALVTIQVNRAERADIATATPEQRIDIIGGEGIGKHSEQLGDHQGTAAIYRYAQTLLYRNLELYLQPDESITVTIILPEGRRLAQRTSNEAFGVVEGLALLGTSGIVQPLSAPEQLAQYRDVLAAKAQQFDDIVFCIGENGLNLAVKLGIHPEQRVKTANWLGPMLVAAGLSSFTSILLLGYHGKLIKLAGGVFHTHHFLADARLEILTTYSALAGLAQPQLDQIFSSPTTEAALAYLRALDEQPSNTTAQPCWVPRIYGAIATAIDRRAEAYIFKQAERTVQVGSLLFDRQQQIITRSQNGALLLSRLC